MIIPKSRFKGGFSLNKTLSSDQCPVEFWKKEGEYFHSIELGIKVKETPNELVVEGEVAKEKLLQQFIADYDIRVLKKFNDPYLNQIYGACKGLRLMNDFNPIHRILHSVITQNTTIERINYMETCLRSQYGDGVYFLPNRCLGKISCRLGYREEYLKIIARALVEGKLDPEKIKSMPTTEARKELMKFKGIGPKVADLILLYGFGKRDAFPMDTWIRKALIREYFGGENTSIRKLRTFALDYFGEHAGLVHLYIFFFERKVRSQLR